MAALSRMANRDHQIRIVEGDTVILASSLIPGNENAVYRVINGLTRWGANVVHKGNAKVHVSGHASAGELLYFYNICKPRNLMPVHGEWRHLRANADLGQLTGIPKDRIVIAEDGVVVDLVDGVAKIAGKVQAGYVYVDGLSVGDITESSLKDRRILGEEGIVSVFVVVDSTHRQDRRRPEHPRPRLGHRGRGLRRRHPQDRGRPVPVRLRRRDGDPPDPAAHPPVRRQMGVRHLPPPPDDPPGGRRGLTLRQAADQERAAGFASGGPLQYVGTTASTRPAETCVLETGLVIPTGKLLLKSETQRRESPEGPVKRF